TFKIVLSNPTDATLSVSTNTVTITDDDVSTIGFTTSAVTVSETNGTLTLTVVRAGATNTAVSVNFATTNGTAAAGSDYTATNGTFSFAAGETTNTLSIDILDNLNQEGTETFQVRLSNASNTSLGVGTSTVTITDDDGSIVGFAVSAISVAENTNSISITVVRSGTTNVAEAGGTLTLTVNRSGTTNNAVTADFATANVTATAGSDYTATNGTLSFAPGETSKTITVDVLDDDLQEANETFRVVLSNPADPTIAIGTNTVRITDDDGSTLSLTTNAVTVAETNTSVTLTVVRSGATNTAVAVDFATTNGTATAGNDYTATNGTFSFPPGEVSNTVTITLIDDLLYEGDEAFRVVLSGITNSTLGIGTNTITIADDDLAYLVFTASSSF